jgi:hypothetical protein
LLLLCRLPVLLGVVFIFEADALEGELDTRLAPTLPVPGPPLTREPLRGDVLRVRRFEGELEDVLHRLGED